MGNIKFSAKFDAGYRYQTVWITDQAPRFVGPDLDLYCLQRIFMIYKSLEIVRTYCHFAQELFEGTVRMILYELTFLGTVGGNCDLSATGFRSLVFSTSEPHQYWVYKCGYLQYQQHNVHLKIR